MSKILFNSRLNLIIEVLETKKDYNDFLMDLSRIAGKWLGNQGEFSENADIEPKIIQHSFFLENKPFNCIERIYLTFSTNGLVSIKIKTPLLEEYNNLKNLAKLGCINLLENIDFVEYYKIAGSDIIVGVGSIPNSDNYILSVTSNYEIEKKYDFSNEEYYLKKELNTGNLKYYTAEGVNCFHLSICYATNRESWKNYCNMFKGRFIASPVINIKTNSEVPEDQELEEGIYTLPLSQKEIESGNWQRAIVLAYALDDAKQLLRKAYPQYQVYLPEY
jgi:hypothetical protein